MRRPPDGAEHHYDVLGCRLSVAATTPAPARAVDRLLAPFHRPGNDGPGYRYVLDAGRRLHRDGLTLAEDRSWPALVEVLLGDINRLAVAGFDGLAVHAGVVAGRDGVIAFPAASGAGKSTLTAACLRAAFDYVSDEALCLDFNGGNVVPYPRPVMCSAHAAALAGLAGGTGFHFGRGEVAVLPEDVGARRAEGDLRLSHVVQLVRTRTPSPPRLEPLDRSKTVAILLGMAFNHYRHPGECFSLATQLALEARAWRLTLGDPEAAAALLGEGLGN